MSSAHDAFKALGPVDWESVDQNDVQSFLMTTFAEAQCLVDSIPVSLTSTTTGRRRSATDPSAKLPGRAPKTSDGAAQLRKEWKEVQVNPRDNPLGINVYRLNSKDRKGAWFARRSIHEGLTFEKWKLGMEREFAESLKVQGKPGDGKIRGIGADKRVVNTVVDGCGKMEVYHLSAQFPGPTAPRDFVTMLLSSDSAMETPMQQGLGKPRYFMVVSKPCNHAQCRQRSGYIRGQYESVEFIREIKVEKKPLRKVRSSIDLGNEEVAAARWDAVERLGKTITIAGSAKGEEEDNDDYESMVEWLMVTRSDPGGNVPRFLVEKGTPAGIVGDANKFLKWISSMRMDDFATDDEVDSKLKEAEEVEQEKGAPTAEPTCNLIVDPAAEPRPIKPDEQVNAPTGFYGMMASALGVAGSAVASRLPNPFGSAKGGDSDSDVSPEDDDTSSIHSFHSFDNESQAEVGAEITRTASSLLNGVTPSSTHSSESVASKSATSTPTQHERELGKLEDRRRKLHEKMQRAQQRALTKKEQDALRDESAIAKLREKHEREVAKQEEKYKREVKRLEGKRAQEQRKADERRRKQVEREEKANLALELDKVRAERDVALKQIEVLKEQVGELQAQNTMLVRQMGKQSKENVQDTLKRANTGMS